MKGIIRVIKGATTVAINRHLGQSGRLWGPDHYGRFIRDGEHLIRVRRDIKWNPVKAKLCQDPSLFPYSPANPDARKRLEVLSGGL